MTKERLQLLQKLNCPLVSRAVVDELLTALFESYAQQIKKLGWIRINQNWWCYPRQNVRCSSLLEAARLCGLIQ
jgi:hypothetical protein